MNDAQNQPVPPAEDTPADRARGVSRRGLVTGAAAVAGAVALTTAGASSAQAAPAARSSAPVGFVLAHEQFRTPQLVQWGSEAEAAGFGYLWTSDHIQPWEDIQGHSMHPWITQGLLSQATRSVTFGTGVTSPIHRHHPSEVAQAFASLGILAPGRVFLGVGAGEALNEKASTGRFGDYAERAGRLVEAVQLIRRLWTGDRVTFDGTYFQTEQFRLYDLPTQPVPIYMAASGPKSAYNAGRYGDGWIGSAKDQMTPKLVAAFERGARDSGRDPASLKRLGELFVNVGTEDLEYAAERWRFTADPWIPTLLYEPNPVQIQRKAEQKWTLREVYAPWPKGGPDAHVQAVQALLDMGVTPFVHSGQRDQSMVIRWYGRNVLPNLRY